MVQFSSIPGELGTGIDIPRIGPRTFASTLLVLSRRFLACSDR